MSDLSDEDLARLFRQGDRGAFELIYEAHRAQVFDYLSALAGDRAMGEDLFRETFLELARRRGEYVGRPPFAIWLYRLARERADARLGRPQAEQGNVIYLRSRVSTPEDEEVDLVNRDAEGSGDSHRLLQGRALRARVAEVVAELPRPGRDVLVLSLWQGREAAQVAAILDLSEGAVGSQLHQAYGCLLDLMQPYLRRMDGQEGVG